MIDIKEQLYKQCEAFIDQRSQTIHNTIKELQEALTSETKSSAGDKHETGRAMVQLEREKAGHQLAEVNKVKEALSKIDTKGISKNVVLGSVVYTSQANYFIAISAGELTVNKNKFYAISPSTPIGKLLIGKGIGDDVVFRDLRLSIEEII